MLIFALTSLALASYIYSLDGTTTYTYLAYATSTFGEHSLISSVQVAQSVISKSCRPLPGPALRALVRSNGLMRFQSHVESLSLPSSLIPRPEEPRISPSVRPAVLYPSQHCNDSPPSRQCFSMSLVSRSCEYSMSEKPNSHVDAV